MSDLLSEQIKSTGKEDKCTAPAGENWPGS